MPPCGGTVRFWDNLTEVSPADPRKGGPMDAKALYGHRPGPYPSPVPNEGVGVRGQRYWEQVT
jgi:hypothetical protein